MTARIDLLNQRFGRLTVIGEKKERYRGKCVWICRCDCGKTVHNIAYVLQIGRVVSCGCLRNEKSGKRYTTHGMYKSDVPNASVLHRRTYGSWHTMLVRCYDSNCVRWMDYGGRGITVCERWRNSFKAFLQDMGTRPEDKTLDRINVNGNYEPSNCRWATQHEQLLNRRINNSESEGVPF